MSDVYIQICRLCLEAVPDGNCEPISKIDKEILEVLLINIDFDISENVACKRCVQKVQDCFDFKSTCFYVDDYITPFVYTDFRVDIRKVFQKVMRVENLNLENVKICRLCMTLIENNAFIYNTDLKEAVPFRDMIRNCLPEVDLNTVHEPSICELCLSSMVRLNDFMKIRHEVEQRIKNYFKVAASHGIPGKTSLDGQLKFNKSRTLTTPVGIEKDNLDTENALMYPINDDTVGIKYEDTISIECEDTISIECEDTISIECEDTINIKCDEDIHIKTEAENGVQTDHFGELRDYSSFGDSRSSKEGTEIKTFASKGKKHFCHKCPYYSNCASNVKKHMLTHSDNEVRRCYVCGFITNTRLSLQAHMVSHRGLTKKYGCPECSFETDDRYYLPRHLLKHKDNSEVKMHKCPLCPLKTKYKTTLLNHQKLQHQENVKIYNCERCSFSTKYKGRFKFHDALHKDPRAILKHKCEMCDYETKYKSSLVMHMRTHEDLKVAIKHPYRCDQCTFSTKTSWNLGVHKGLHQKDGAPMPEEKYKCQLCTYQAKTTRSIKNHMIKAHTDSHSSTKQ